MSHLALISKGEVLQHVASNAYMEVPCMVNRDLVAHAGTSTVPFNNVKTNVHITILKHLRETEKEINKVFLVIERKNMAPNPHVKVRNPDKWATFSLSYTAKLVSEYRLQSWPTLVATHKYIMGHPMEFMPQLQTHRLALTYNVHPENHLVALQQVVDLVRKRSLGPNVFPEKARKLIINS